MLSVTNGNCKCNASLGLGFSQLIALPSDTHGHDSPTATKHNLTHTHTPCRKWLERREPE